MAYHINHQSRCSIVVSIPACHAGDPGSIPGNGVFVFAGAWSLNREGVSAFSIGLAKR
jgi:hypothetical protein